MSDCVNDPPLPEKSLLESNNNDSVDTVDSTVNFNRLPTYLTIYFTFKEVKENSLIVQCTLCVQGKTLSTPLNSTGNLYKHLRVSIFTYYLRLHM